MIDSDMYYDQLKRLNQAIEKKTKYDKRVDHCVPVRQSQTTHIFEDL